MHDAARKGCRRRGDDKEEEAAVSATTMQKCGDVHTEIMAPVLVHVADTISSPCCTTRVTTCVADFSARTAETRAAQTNRE